MVKKVNSDTKGLTKILESMKTYCVLLCDEQKIPDCSICRFQLAKEQVAMDADVKSQTEENKKKEITLSAESTFTSMPETVR